MHVRHHLRGTRRRVGAALPAVAAVAAASLVLLSSATPALAATFKVSEVRVPTPLRGPNSITVGSDGALWFTDFNDSAVGRLGPHGFSSFALPSRIGPESIVSGPDGALWFTDHYNPLIWRITTKGVISSVKIPACTGCQYSGGSGTGNLTVGPDGALWYSRPGNIAIGRLTTNGHVHEFPVSPNFGSYPGYLATGPDGALWFTISSGVARMTTSGSQKVVWNGLNYPSSITTGPDGNLWVTGAYEDVVARLTTKGQATIFPLQPGCYAWDISPGNGALWVPCQNSALVYRVSIHGVPTAIKVPSGSTENTQIVQAPDHSIWFTETAVSLLGKITS